MGARIGLTSGLQISCRVAGGGFRYQSVHKSTHFDASVSSEYKTLPAELMPVLRAAMPFYQALSPHRIKPALGPITAFIVRDLMLQPTARHGMLGNNLRCF